MNGWKHHEPHPVTGTCVWCHANSTSSVGCTRGESAEEKVARLESELASARAENERLAMELTRLKSRRFPVLHGGATVPWQMLAPFEPQALANHGQSLETLASRGGLGWSEMLAVIEGKRLRFVRETSDDVARPLVLKRVIEFEAGSLLPTGVKESP